MKIKKYYKWIIIGLFVLVILLYTNKESFVEQVGRHIYSTTSYRRKKYKGNNIKPKISDINSNDCFKLCISMDECSGYVMDNSYCYLKKGNITKDNLSDDIDSKTFIINKIKGKLNKIKNKKSIATTINEYNNVSYTDCYNYCVMNDNCSGFVTDLDLGNGQGNCRLKTNDIYNHQNIISKNGKMITTIT
jgi:hypothetical protein